MKLLINWFKESNHDKHALAGLGILIVYFILGIILSLNFNQTLLISNVSILACMITAEYKDKLHRCKFDWEDILAGMIFPLVLDIITCIIYIIK